ncbi:hypothetical protein GCM10023116_21120 [Kistimonas scapharcae]|uniref:Uncharacterized protein n=1 Tax=Kistimonas scapharcae TaxID=1036133 RepID=A0ABP8V222_9GAMM
MISKAPQRPLSGEQSVQSPQPEADSDAESYASTLQAPATSRESWRVKSRMIEIIDENREEQTSQFLQCFCKAWDEYHADKAKKQEGAKESSLVLIGHGAYSKVYYHKEYNEIACKLSLSHPDDISKTQEYSSFLLHEVTQYTLTPA